MPATFIKALTGQSATAPALPLVHTTSSPTFEYDIGPQGKLAAKTCKVYKEDLVYFFYGKPSYRPADEDALHHADMKQFAPVCLVIDVPASVRPRRVLPFDSGAYHDGLMMREGHAHRSLRKELFELQGRDAPGAIVGLFFGSNLAYYYERPMSPPRTDPSLNTCVETYISLITRTGSNRGDSRLNSIEVQFSQDIDLTVAGTVLAVAMAEQLYQQREEIAETLKAWGAEPLLYELGPRFTAGACCQDIDRMVGRFLNDRGFF